MDQLRQAAQSPVNSKTQNCLISTTEFDPDMSEQTNRGLDNIKRIWGIWLDIDGGDMPASQLPKIFPDIRMAVFNSNSLGNYRSFIPTKDYLSIDEYTGITRLIVNRIQQHTTDAEHEAARYQNRRPFTYVSHQKAKKLKQQYGQVRPVHGVDLTKLTPNSMFYLPSLCGDDTNASFFIDHNDENRHILDHRQWLETNPADIEDIEHSYVEFERSQPKQQKQTTPNLVVDAPSISPDAIIEKAIREYAAVADGTGRHRAFFKAAWIIHNHANIPLSELEQHLTLCDYDGHQSKNYKGIIKQLANPKYQLKHKH